MRDQLLSRLRPTTDRVAADDRDLSRTRLCHGHQTGMTENPGADQERGDEESEGDKVVPPTTSKGQRDSDE